MNIIDRIIKWNKDRLLDKQEFNIEVEITNILEELIEMVNSDIDSNKAREIAISLKDTIMQYKGNSDKNNISDSLNDIVVFSIGALLKLGINPKCSMNETLKEIESRTGSIIDGKFVKDISEEAKSKWYKADYNKCFKR